MTYEKAKAESISFVGLEVFMGLSKDYPTAQAALLDNCGGFNGDPTKFTCNSFGGYTNIPNGASGSVTIGQGTTHVFVFDHTGNHWKCSGYTN